MFSEDISSFHEIPYNWTLDEYVDGRKNRIDVFMSSFQKN